MSRPRHRRHRPMHEIPAYRNPVAAAVARESMRDAARAERIATLMMIDGEDATEALAHHAWIIGLGAEVALQVVGTEHPALRRLHGALRSVAAMCLHHGYCWRADHAMPLEAALAEAHELITRHPAQAARFTRDADFLAWAITQHKLPPDAIAGAELYTNDRAMRHAREEDRLCGS